MAQKMKEQRQFLHVQQLDLFLFLFSSFKGVPSTIERIALFKERSFELLLRLLQE
jgi:hypothetical protein